MPDIVKTLRQAGARGPLVLLLGFALSACSPGVSGPERARKVAALQGLVEPLTDDAGSPEPLLQKIGDAEVVLMGDATHGTREFYALRAELTRQLIEQKGFTAIALEGDWIDARQANDVLAGRSAGDALAGFAGYPSWTWRNTTVRDFMDWLSQYNATARQEGRPGVGVYGLDFNRIGSSARAVMTTLDAIDPAAAERARQRYGCVLSSSSGSDDDDTRKLEERTCQAGLADELSELSSRVAGDAGADDALFDALENARVVKEGRSYLSVQATGGASWNVRDLHMASVVNDLRTHLERRDGAPARIVVWAHSSHVGDAQATEMAQAGEISLGQVVRSRYGDRAFLVGLSTSSGTVSAASVAGGLPEVQRLRPALTESYEALFHQVGTPRFALPLRDPPAANDALSGQWLERQVGLVYLPQTERESHYVEARLAEQFDLLIHVDETHAVEPLERPDGWVP